MEYYFVTEAEFEEMVKADQFVEHCLVHGKHYGTAKSELERIAKAQKICILEIDVQGAQKIANAHIDANFLFIYPPSLEELHRRLANRGTESEAQVLSRFETGKKEIEFGEKSGLFQHKLVNDVLEASYKLFEELLFKLYQTELQILHKPSP